MSGRLQSAEEERGAPPQRRPPQRRPLPLEPDALPPLGPHFAAALERGCSELRLELSPGQRTALEAHARLLLAWNRHVNLTAIRTEADVARLHVVDSLTALQVIRGLAPTLSLLDLGSGGGYPGLALAALLPASRVALVDSVGKKIRFLEVAAAAVTSALDRAGEPSPRVTAVHTRAEELARAFEQRESWDVVTARAVGSLAEVAELSLPLLRTGGRLIAWKRAVERGALRDELDAAAAVISAAGGSRPTRLAVPIAELPGHCLIVVRKVWPTPSRFPRNPADRRRP